MDQDNKLTIINNKFMDQERTKMGNSFDQNLKSTHEGQADFVQHGVVVVDIDKKSCIKYGEPRQSHANFSSWHV